MIVPMTKLKRPLHMRNKERAEVAEESQKAKQKAYRGSRVEKILKSFFVGDLNIGEAKERLSEIGSTIPIERETVQDRIEDLVDEMMERENGDEENGVRNLGYMIRAIITILQEHDDQL